MLPRASTFIIAVLMLHGMTCATASMAAEGPRTVRLDGKILFIPEINLTQQTTPVTSFLFAGAWRDNAKAKDAQQPLCRIGAANRSIIIRSPEKLLPGSRTKVVNENNLETFLDEIEWRGRQVTHTVFRVVSRTRQPAVIELSADADTMLFHNGKAVACVPASSVVDTEGRAFLPIMLEAGRRNVINIKQVSRSKPSLQPVIHLDRSYDLLAAWQARGGFLKKLLYMSGEPDDVPVLDWSEHLEEFTISLLEVRDMSTGDIVLGKESVRPGRIIDDESKNLAPGIYEAVYQAQDDSVSEFFIIGYPGDVFADLRDKLSKYNPDKGARLVIDAQLHRAQVLLSQRSNDVFDKLWQEKIIHTLLSLASMERQLRDGATNIAKDQPGLHIRGFESKADNSFQSYRIFIPSNYDPGTPLPLLVMASTRVANKERPFIEGPVMANHREALLWAKYAEKHGFALLWPGYRSTPDGYSYESVHINEAIQAVEKDYYIDKHRISVYGTCGAGYNAGRLVAEYNNRFAAIVYDRAVFDLSLSAIRFTPSLKEWYATVNPSRHVLANRNLRIFVMHDDSKPAGHGPMELTTRFLDQTARIRDDVVSYLAERPMTPAARIDMTFSWLAACRNENPEHARSQFLAKAGYTGPIMEIFATTIIVVEGTRASGSDREGIHHVVESMRLDYTKRFHGAECVVKKDSELTQHDIDNHSLILVGNSKSNTVWEKLQPYLPVKVISTEVLYENDRLCGNRPFQAIARHPSASDKYVLMLGAGDLRTLGQLKTNNLFTAWYDCITTNPRTIISKLGARDARSAY